MALRLVVSLKVLLLMFKQKKISKKIINLSAFLWIIGQFIVVFLYLAWIHGNSIIAFCLFPVVWQILTETGYSLARFLGYHSTAYGKTLSNGNGGRLPFPDFVPNTPSYTARYFDLSTSDKFLRLVFASSCAFIIGILMTCELAIILNLKEYGELLSIIIFLFLWLVLILVWKGYQRLFAHVFGLKIIWYENSRPVFKKIVDRKQ